ncbi:DUF305 domain-containing protein [Rhizobium leguminosarum]|uniref:DUF305 domain-containing protein n=2 Tax=Rhizobium/Agrobacterium group TaxID=227290 RepID=A0ABY1XHF7_9HYPH|nr:DUF305 domain-containing protein [Rhizobium leguminosarum]TBC91783.1 DUF305 domain-containing protein [Rhizobium leguminosarum]TBE58176.1 DUF305 domain-containing protein [Rhizobium beringeri]
MSTPDITRRKKSMNIWSHRKSTVLAAAILATAGTCAAFAHDPVQHIHPANLVADATEAAFLAENNTAMDKMMADMEVKPTGDVDRDFVAMMTPHHQGAIDMALAVLKYGKNEQLKRIAQEIIVDQQQEIAAMKLATGDPLPPSDAAPTQLAPETTPAESMQSMDPGMKM